MLCLTRKIKDSIIINDNIKLTVLSVRGKQVKLGFEAPEGNKILRSEIVDKQKAEINQ